MAARKKSKLSRFLLLFGLAIIMLHQAGSMHQFFQDGYILSTLLDYFFWTVLVSIIVASVIWLVNNGQQKRRVLTVYGFVLVFVVLFVPEYVVRLVGKERSYLEENGEWGYNSLSVFRSPTWLVKCEPNDKGSYRKTEYEQRWSSNSLGYVDREWDPSANGLKIMSLGDSFTEGLGGDQPWVKELSTLLDKQCGVKNYYYNGGISGHDPLLSYQNLSIDLLAYKPDVVMLAVNASDLDDIVARGCFDRFILTDDGDSLIVNTEQKKLEYLYAVSHVTRTILHAMGYDWTLMNTEDRALKVEAAKLCLASAIGKFKELSESRGFRFCVVFHPSIHNVERNNMEEFELIKNRLDQQQINYIDILGYYHDSLHMNKDNVYDYFWPMDRHQKDYKIFAEGILNKLGCEYFEPNDTTIH